ncbi:predicted GPI-anchored protein 58 [Drosophila rhopaloa]|uniref:Uncharacterized protein n=1 Tax=Drosophila rhopaloa TaxID=1041015 RepID=A0ABM5J138_DRORH|nr:predicted GPI-anchored protein 58 [Drosophila rhopaloa]
MSSVITRAEARRRMAAQQGPNPLQGWSAARPTRTPWRFLKRARTVESSPEPVISSDSDVEVIDDPIAEQREWRPRKATRAGRIPPGTSAIGGQTPEARDVEVTPSIGHIEAVSRAMAESQARPGVRDPTEQERAREEGQAAPPPQEPRPEEKDEEEEWAPSPPRWLPEVPLTPRYEPEWHRGEDPASEGEAPRATPPWRPARPPTPRYHQPEAKPKTPGPRRDATPVRTGASVAPPAAMEA